MPTRIAIIGAGGLGTPAAWAIASGFKGGDSLEVSIIDPDKVELSNLNRQVLFQSADLGLPKAAVLAGRLSALYPNLQLGFLAVEAAVDAGSIFSLLEGAGIVLECSDSTETKFLVNDYCVARKIPFAYGGVVGTAGQLLEYAPGGSAAGCLRCLFGAFSAREIDSQTATCRSAGIVGPIAGQVGMWQGAFALAASRPGFHRESRLIRVGGFGRRVTQTAVEPSAECPLGCGIERLNLLDLRARTCPSTFVFTKVALEQMAEGAVVDARYSSAESASNVSRSLSQEGHSIIGSQQLDSTTWRVLIRKRNGRPMELL